MLIFHHGGLSASHELELKKPEHCSAFLRIMLSILLWQSPADAGFPEFTDGMTWVLPSKVGTVEVKQKEVLYYHPSIRSRETFVALLEREKPPPSPTAQATPLPTPQATSSGAQTRSKTKTRAQATGVYSDFFLAVACL